MVSVAQLVEHQVVVLVAVGPIPTIHPKFEIFGMWRNGSALALGARGCQFESGHPDQFKKPAS